VISAEDLEVGKTALLRARRDPVWWVETTFGEKVLGKQNDILRALAEPGVTEIHVPSCHNSGKTHIAARALLWWLSVWPEKSKVVSTAPTWHQVEDLLWSEVNGGFLKSRAPLGGRMLTTRWNLGPEWFGIGLSTDEAVNLQGYHAEHVLIIVDEADGIPFDIWTAIDGLTTTRHAVILAIGNPLDPQSEWKKRHDLAESSPNKRVIHIDDEDVLPFAEKYPFMLQQRWVDEKREVWGEGSPLWLGKVKAKWPDQGADTLIPMAWLTAAKGRTAARGLRTSGWDIARFGTDRTVGTLMEGNWMLKQVVRRQQDTYVTSSEIISSILQDSPVAVAMDGVGLGAGVVDNVNAWKAQTKSAISLFNFNAGARPVGGSAEEEMYSDLAAQWYWKVRLGFEKGLYGFAMDQPDLVDTLINELNQPKYGYVERGKIRINKFGLKVTQSEATLPAEQRAQRSPDLADSFVLAANAAAEYVGMTEVPRKVTTYHQWRPGQVNA
jgi:phage terminase large subunit